MLPKHLCVCVCVCVCVCLFVKKWQAYFSQRTTKPTHLHMRPAKTQISLGICSVWSESSLATWRNLGSLATYWAHRKDSDQTVRKPRLIWETGRMPRLIWVFSGRTCHWVSRLPPWPPSCVLELSELAILNLHVTPMPPIKFQLNLIYCLGGDVVWRILKDGRHGRLGTERF